MWYPIMLCKKTAKYELLKLGKQKNLIWTGQGRVL